VLKSPTPLKVTVTPVTVASTFFVAAVGVPVGATVGVPVGVAVGTSFCGVGLGDRVGAVVGVAVGGSVTGAAVEGIMVVAVGVGAIVGTKEMVGAELLAGVGAVVFVSDGMLVGAIVALAAGSNEALTVGEKEAVGKIVPVTDGDGVRPFTVTHSRSNRTAVAAVGDFIIVRLC
jgi:hypothetical protein